MLVSRCLNGLGPQYVAGELYMSICVLRRLDAVILYALSILITKIQASWIYYSWCWSANQSEMKIFRLPSRFTPDVCNTTADRLSLFLWTNSSILDAYTVVVVTIDSARSISELPYDWSAKVSVCWNRAAPDSYLCHRPSHSPGNRQHKVRLGISA